MKYGRWFTLDGIIKCYLHIMWLSNYSNVRCTGLEQLCALHNWRFVVLTTDTMKITVFWDVMPINLVDTYLSTNLHGIIPQDLIQWNCYACAMKTYLCSGVHIINWYVHLAVSAYEEVFFRVLHYTYLATAHYFPACSVLFLSYDISIYFFISPGFIYLFLVLTGILLLV